MGRQKENPPWYSSLIEEKKQYRTNIPKPVAEIIKEKSNSEWKVSFKFEKNKKGNKTIRLYWEPLE